MSGNSIFISYRRDDTAGEAGRLAEHLERQFGADRVFFDIEAIEPGTDFVQELERALDVGSVMIVMIGRRWLSAANADGTRRLDSPNDFVRREVATALKRGTRVIPVLVQNVVMPSAEELPPDLAALATRQAMSIQHEEFGDDARRVAEAIARLLGESPASASAAPRARSKRGLVIGLAAAAALLAGIVIVKQQRDSSRASSATASADSAREARQEAISNLVRIATAQGDRSQFDEAIATLDSAILIDADVTRAKVLQEDLAMRWIRDLKVTSGQTFTSAMTRPLAILDRAATGASGSRHGDILAHLGWAMFLRWRDDRSNPTPTAAYQRALAADSANPFANVMLGHWILSYENRPDALARARSHFRVAADSRRELATVRRFQLAALGNDRSPESRLETIRVFDEMRTRSEPRPTAVNDVWSTYYFALNGQSGLTVSDLMTALPAVDHLQTYQWAFDEYSRSDEARRQQFRFYVARLRAEAGEGTSAADSLRVLRKELERSSGMLRNAVDAALEKLNAR